MHHIAGRNILVRLRKKWMYKALLSQFLLALAVTVLVYTLLYKLFSLPVLAAVPCLFLLFFIIAATNRSWKLDEYDVSRFLNITLPSLEESAQLILKPHSALNLLEKLQAEKVEIELLSVKLQDPFKKRITISLMILLAASLISIVLFAVPFRFMMAERAYKAKQTSSVNTIPETVLPEIKNANITITPPSYTGKSSRQQGRFNLLAEEGAIVTWHLQTNLPAKTVQLIFNDGKILSLSYNADNKSWKTQKQVHTSGFYQVKIDNKLSDLYKIEAIKDQPPAIVIQTPKPNTFINYGQAEKILLRASITDDYGITTANISAIVSSGKGEAVKFKEQTLSFANFSPGRKVSDLQRLLDCKALGMQPGDELYYFISAIDNNKRETRSEVYIITLQDTADQTSIGGLVSPVDLKTELFRSQRQIIIETEQLIKNRSKLSVKEFTDKSNNLGIDQKLLRMRYGKFLGDETHAEMGELIKDDDHDDHDDHDESAEDKAAKIIEEYSHIHDNAEDATFFDSATKRQLKLTLTEMWNAEIKLRTILPKEALPYEYKALKLLKELQQKSRVYVAKTGLKTTPLQLDKRFTGDLSKIKQPVKQQSFIKPGKGTNTVRRALGILEELKANGTVSSSANQILQQAFYQLSVQAANEPSIYLSSLSALKKILSEQYRVRDINMAAQGLQKMGAVAEKLPYSKTNAAMGLSKQYFINVNKSSR